MKIAFSTIGCPEWSWSEIVSMANDRGFGSIKIRGWAVETLSLKEAAAIETA